MAQRAQAPADTDITRLREAGKQTAARQEELLAAVADLQAALATPGDGDGWFGQVRSACERMHARLRSHVEDAESPDGLLAEITRIEPSFDPKVQRLQREHEALLERGAALEQLAQQASSPDELRALATEVVAAVEGHRHRASALLLDAYNLDVSAND